MKTSPTSSFTVTRTRSTRIEVQLSRELDAAEMQVLEAAILAELEQGRAPSQVVMDLSRMKACSAQGRQMLYQLQVALASHGVRTSYVAHTPRARGYAHWSGRQPGGQSAHAVRAEQAARWDGGAGRREVVDDRWEGAEGGRRRARR